MHTNEETESKWQSNSNAFTVSMQALFNDTAHKQKRRETHSLWVEYFNLKSYANTHTHTASIILFLSLYYFYSHFGMHKNENALNLELFIMWMCARDAHTLAHTHAQTCKPTGQWKEQQPLRWAKKKLKRASSGSSKRAVADTSVGNPNFYTKNRKYINKRNEKPFGLTLILFGCCRCRMVPLLLLLRLPPPSRNTLLTISRTKLLFKTYTAHRYKWGIKKIYIKLVINVYPRCF